MKILKRICMAVVLVLIVILALPVYVGMPIEGRIVNRESGEALRGAAVLVVWELESIVAAGNPEYLRLAGAVSSQDGAFRVTGWGPDVPAVPFFFRVPPDSPELWIFMPGYEFRRIRNVWPIRFNWRDVFLRPLIRAGLTENPISLQPLDPGNKQRLAQEADNLREELIMLRGSCRWQFFPEFADKVDEFGAGLAEQGISNSLSPSVFGGGDCPR